MTQGNYGAYRPTGPMRPTALTIVAIVAIVFASLGLMCNVAGVVQSVMLGQGVSFGGQDVAQAAAKLPGWAIGFNVVHSVCGFIIWLLWMITGIALLRSSSASARRMGLKVAVAHFVFLIVFAIGGAVVATAMKDITLEQVRLRQQMMSQSAPNPNANAMQQVTERFALVVMYGGVACGFVFGAILPVWMSIVLRRPDVVAFCDGAPEQPTPGYFPPPPPPGY